MYHTRLARQPGMLGIFLKYLLSPEKGLFWFNMKKCKQKIFDPLGGSMENVDRKILGSLRFVVHWTCIVCILWLHAKLKFLHKIHEIWKKSVKTF